MDHEPSRAMPNSKMLLNWVKPFDRHDENRYNKHVLPPATKASEVSDYVELIAILIIEWSKMLLNGKNDGSKGC